VTVLVDSDILIEVTRARDPVLVIEWQSLVDSQCTICYSPVTLAELWRGARPSEHSLLTGLFESLLCVPIDAAIGRLAGDILHLHAKSHSLGIPDALIAATAITHDASLWTCNRKHYPIKRLKFY
jgi:predicted nucleic acid-binding protein